jgi:hypothetical protein
MLYVDWVDRVLIALDRTMTGDADASLIGVSVQHMQQELGVAGTDEGYTAVATAINDLELMSCAEADRLTAKLTIQGHRLARAGGLRAGWKSLFDKYLPLDEDREVLAKAVEMSLHETQDLAWTGPVEIKEVQRELGRPVDQGDAIAVTKRLQALGCLHSDARITMGGNEGRCAAHPTYVAIVLTTQRVTTEDRTLLNDLIEEWETTSVDVKEVLELGSDRQKAEFCKDVLALANTRVSGRRFLLIGFNDLTREFTTSIDPALTSNQLEGVLSAYCTPVPEIRLSMVPWDVATAAVIEVLSRPEALPYKLAREVWKLQANSVFVRHNTLVEQAVGEELASLVAEGERARRLR